MISVLAAGSSVRSWMVPITMVSGTANTENLCSLIKALYENALVYLQLYFEGFFL